MSGLINNVYNFLFRERDSHVLPLEEALEYFKKAEEDDSTQNTETEEVINDQECFQGVGKLTYIDDHCGCIDGTLYFDNCTLRDLVVGCSVQYLAYKIAGKTKISKVLAVADNDWEPALTEKHFWFRRKDVGKVTERNERDVIIEPGNIRCDLNKVQSEFVPVVGDWVELESLVQVDENVTDLHGEILEITRISPLRPKIVIGVIKKWADQLMLGIIDSDIFFTKDACIPGYLPVIGDKVTAEVIESEQNRCVWRALKVVPEEERTVKQDLSENNSDLAALLENKHGIVITDNINVTLKSIGEKALFVIEVINTQKSRNLIAGYFKMKKNEQSQITLQSPKIGKGIMIDNNQTIIFRFLCTSKFMGITKELYVFLFDGFEIGRWITIEVTPELDLAKANNFATNKNKMHVIKSARAAMLDTTTNDILLGQKPVRPPSFITNKLPMFDIPSRLTEALFKQMENHSYIGEIPIEKVSPCLMAKLSIQSYADRFHTLVYLEELSLQINMHKYDMERASFIKHNEYLMLEVADLNERRPSVILGDKVMASNPNNPTVKLEGFVHKTGAKHVYIKFHQNFHESYNGEDYTVEFQSSRTNFRRYHQAIDLAIKNLGPDLLFPTCVKLKQSQLIFECAEECSSTKSRDELLLEMERLSVAKKIDNTNRKVTSDSKNIMINVKVNEATDNVLKNDKLDTSTENVAADTSSDSSKLENESDAKQESRYTRMARLGLIKKRNSASPENKLSQTTQSEIQLAPGVCPVKLEWFDKKLNYFQRRAVVNILKGEARPLPYFIFGPPGTGKTVTLIETILQLVRLIPHSRLLVVAPSNSAADLIALRLLDSGILLPGDLVRMVAFRCVADGTIPERLVPFCVTGDISREGSRESKFSRNNGVKIGVQASVLGRHRITIGTCMVVGNIYTMGFPRGHFTHILVDEAGQATEPEVLIPLCLLDTRSAQTILAGDPLQLGPCVFSRLSEAHGLSESYFERLINRFPYIRDPVGFPETGGYDPRLVTRLVYNYRSLPEILALPNKLFYDSELKPTISSTEGSEVDLLKHLGDILPKRKLGHPPAVVFHGVRGENFQTADSPSWYNPSEAGQVYYYVNDLYRFGLSAKDIGIITPYIKQGQQVRSLFNEMILELPKIGSVEEFQGQEFKVIVLTTVRSNEAGAKTDTKYGLGFMASPRRLNVAITRAQALLIIIGNPHLLCTDNYWRSVLSYAIKIGGYRGCDLPNLNN